MNYCTSHDAVVAEDHSNSTIPKVVGNDDDGDDAKSVAIVENNPKMVVAETDSRRKKSYKLTEF